jgi:hypothetical protein
MKKAKENEFKRAESNCEVCRWTRRKRFEQCEAWNLTERVVEIPETRRQICKSRDVI